MPGQAAASAFVRRTTILHSPPADCLTLSAKLFTYFSKRTSAKASQSSWSFTFLFKPKVKFSRMLPEMMVFSWSTTLNRLRHCRREKSVLAWPFKLIRPASIGYKRVMTLTKVLLPAPVAPTRAIFHRSWLLNQPFPVPAAPGKRN